MKIDFRDPSVQQARFLPKALEINEVKHQLYNALQAVVQVEEEWRWGADYLTAVCRILGQRQWKDPLLNSMLRGHPLEMRSLIIQYHGSHLDWRWGYLEFVLTLLCPVWEHFSSTFDSSVFGNSEKDDALTVQKCGDVCGTHWRRFTALILEYHHR